MIRPRLRLTAAAAAAEAAAEVNLPRQRVAKPSQLKARCREDN
jgi:hypothetical protein